MRELPCQYLGIPDFEVQKCRVLKDSILEFIAMVLDRYPVFDVGTAT